MDPRSSTPPLAAASAATAAAPTRWADPLPRATPGTGQAVAHRAAEAAATWQIIGPNGAGSRPGPATVWRRGALLLGLLVAMPRAGSAASPTAAPSQSGDPEKVRVGVTVGGTSFVGLTLEYQWGTRALELTAGTFSLKDLSVTAVGKQYVGGGSVRGFVGAGLWGVVAFGEERPGFALVARAPLGVDWQTVSRHAVGLEVALNRALAVRRTDPEDDTPPRKRVVPLPGLYYRYTTER